MQTWNKERRPMLFTTLRPWHVVVLKCLYTRYYLFIILIEVFDLKVVDPEWCFDLPTKLENILLVRNLIWSQRARYENESTSIMAGWWTLQTAFRCTNSSEKSKQVSLSSGQHLVGFVIRIFVDISSFVLRVVYCLRARAASGPAVGLTAPALLGGLG